MKPAITLAREAIEFAIKDLKEAIQRAHGVNRMVERNLEIRVSQLEQELKSFQWHEEYILQPLFTKFVKREGE